MLPERRQGSLPEIPLAETDEILSSWVSRTAAVYHARPEALLEQVGVMELSAAVLDRHATAADLEKLSIALYSSPRAIGGMCFAGQSREALELVAHRAPLWTCGGAPGTSSATRAMRALAAPLPVDKRVRYLARNRGRLPFSPGRTPPLLWQLSDTKRLRRHTHEYRNWRPPADRPPHGPRSGKWPQPPVSTPSRPRAWKPGASLPIWAWWTRATSSS